MTDRFLSADRSSPFSSLTHESDSSRERVLLMLAGPVLVLQKEEFDNTCNNQIDNVLYEYDISLQFMTTNYISYPAWLPLASALATSARCSSTFALRLSALSRISFPPRKCVNSLETTYNNGYGLCSSLPYSIDLVSHHLTCGVTSGMGR